MMKVPISINGHAVTIELPYPAEFSAAGFIAEAEKMGIHGKNVLYLTPFGQKGWLQGDVLCLCKGLQAVVGDFTKAEQSEAVSSDMPIAKAMQFLVEHMLHV